MDAGAALFRVGLTLVEFCCWLATEGRGLLLYGPKYWRVRRKLDRRRYARETGHDRR